MLGLDRVGPEDSFFELGGHSLLAVSLAERLRERGLPVAVRTLFAAPTPAELAAAAGPAEVDRAAAGHPRRREVITPDMLPLVDLTQDQIDAITARGARRGGQRGRRVPAGPAPGRHLLPPPDGGPRRRRTPTSCPSVLRFDSRDRLDDFLAALQQVVDRHDIFRTAMAWQACPSRSRSSGGTPTLPVTEVTLDPARTRRLSCWPRPGRGWT